MSIFANTGSVSNTDSRNILILALSATLSPMISLRYLVKIAILNINILDVLAVTIVQDFDILRRRSMSNTELQNTARTGRVRHTWSKGDPPPLPPSELYFVDSPLSKAGGASVQILYHPLCTAQRVNSE